MTALQWPSWRESLGKDALASVVVFLVALPLCMGIAIASGVPPALGLITGIVGGIIVGSIAGSPLQVSGPAAGLAVIVWQLVQDFGLGTLGVIVIGAGLLQFVAGMVRAGQVFRAVAPAVIHGMLGGIGVLIFASQFHVMVDDAPKGNGLSNLLSIPGAIYKGVMPLDGSTHHQAALIGLITIVAIMAWLKFAPKKLKMIPAPLVAVVLGVAAAAALNLPIKFVSVPDNLLSAITLPTADSFARLADLDILKAMVALAIIASAETLLCATAIDQKHDGPRTDYDKELRAQGVGNLICGVLGALPMTGVIVRSTANVEAGGRTRNSAILHGAWILVLVVAAPFVLAVIPIAALAALLVYTGYKLVNPAQIKTLHKAGRAQLAIYLVTLIGIVVTNLLTGVMIGVAASVIRLIYTLTHLEANLTQDGARYDLRLSGTATFVRLPLLASTLAKVPPSAELHVHIEKLAHADHASLDAIMSWERQAERAGGRLVLEWEELFARFRAPRLAGTEPAAAPTGAALVSAK